MVDIDKFKSVNDIRAAVASFDWESIAPGLHVSVSIGASEARADDTAESVLQRSDESMYRAKAAV